jgi:hypothetical protein
MHDDGMTHAIALGMQGFLDQQRPAVLTPRQHTALAAPGKFQRQMCLPVRCGGGQGVLRGDVHNFWRYLKKMIVPIFELYRKLGTIA